MGRLFKAATVFIVFLGILLQVFFSPVYAATGTNLIPNPSVAAADSSGSTPASWLKGSWGTNAPIFTYLNTGYDDNRSMQVQLTSYTSGDAKWYFAPVAVTGGGLYNFSDYYMSTVATDIVAQYSDTSGNLSYQYLGSAIATSSWQQFSVTLTAPATAKQVTIFHLISSIGSLTTDDFSLTSTVAAALASITSPTANETVSGNVKLTAQVINANNLLGLQFLIDGQNVGLLITTAPYELMWDSATADNGSHVTSVSATSIDGNITTSAPVIFSVSNGTPANGNMIPNPQLISADPSNSSLPKDWQTGKWGTNKTGFSYLNTGYNDNRSLQVQVTSYSSGDAKWFFTPQYVQQDVQYNYTEYYKSTVPTEIVATFTMADGGTVYQTIGQPASAQNWAKFTTDFLVPVGAQKVTVYHLIYNVGTLTTDAFSLSPYTPVGFNRAIISLTFDDGFKSFYNYGLPVLKQYGFVSTQYIVTGFIGQTGYMARTDIQKLYSGGHEIASHTVTHPDLTQKSTTQITNELSRSQSTIKSWLGVAPSSLAYPYGSFNSNVISIAQKYYKSGRSVESGLNSKNSFNPYDIRVQNISNTTSSTQVADWVKQAIQTKTWLVLVYHSVDPSSTPFSGPEYNITPTQLSDQLSAIKSSGIAVLTMQQAFAEVTGQLGG